MFDAIKEAASAVTDTTWGRIAIVVVIALIAMFIWSRSEGLTMSPKDRVFGVIPVSAALPSRRTY